MSFTTDDSLREKLYNHMIPEDFPNVPILSKLASKAKKIRTLMQEEKLTFKQSNAYLKAMENRNLFVAHNLVPKVPQEIYLEILSKLVDCSVDDARKIYAVANKRIKKWQIADHSLFSQNKINIVKEENQKILEASKIEITKP